MKKVSNLRQVLIFLFFLFAIKSIAQQPSYFTIGSETFANSHVYSLLMHSENILYTTTNYGMFVYRNGNFKEISPAKGQLGSALFSLIENRKGEVFCSNLAGQIFRLNEDKLELYLKVPQQYIGDNIEINFNHKDELIVRSKVHLLYSAKQWKVLYDPEPSSTLGVNGFYKNRVLIPMHSNYEILLVQGDSVKPIPIDSSLSGLTDNKRQFPAFLDDALVSLYNTGLFINHSTSNISQLELSNIRAFHQVGHNEIWGLNKRYGAQRMYLEQGDLILSNLLMEESFISAVTQAKNGTIYLGTFNQGIHVIPNISSSLYSMDNSFFTGITASSNSLYAIDRSGSIFDVSEQGAHLLIKEGAFSRGNIFSIAGFDFNLIANRKSIFFDDRTSILSKNIGLVKAVALVDSTTFIVATSQGVFRRGSNANHLNWLPAAFNNNWSQLSETKFRCKAVSYDITNASLYYATHDGLVYVNKNGEKSKLLFHGSPIDCNYLFYGNSTIWCGTQSQGILNIKDGKIINQITTSNGLKSNYIRKIQWYENKLYISHVSGFQILDLSSNSWKSIGTKEGIISGSIDDFVVFEDNIWAVSKGKIICLPLNQLNNKTDFNFTVLSIQLGDSLLTEKTSSILPHHQNHFKAFFDFRGIEFESEALIQYRMIGLSDQWESLDATTEKVEFNALAAGEYQFETRTKYREFNTPTQSYSFTITPPFWQTGWFYALLVIGTVVSMIILFTIRFKHARKEQERELNQQKLKTDMLDSELKALRSQMNPHFIFNSLNSIQDLILREDKENSYDYIVLFSKLVRNTLNYSNKSFIPIEKELEFLDVYLSLEKLRFGDHFEYAIQYKGSKDITIPSMLIQPFIENALVHGLMHKKGLKKLNILFDMSEKLSCTVIDNGIGRTKANEILQRQRGDHSSFAISAIEQRLQLLNQQLGENAGSYEVIDLYEDDLAAGTKVEINIPFRNHNSLVK